MQRVIWGAALVSLAVAVGCSSSPKATPVTPPSWTVQGVVSDAVTSLPIKGATVELYAGGSGLTKTTDGNGFFSFPKLSEGNNLVVSVSAAGYLAATFTVSSSYVPSGVVDGGTLQPADLIAANAYLQPIPVPLIDGGSPTWSVQGTVTDSTTGQAIVGATATLYNGTAAMQMQTTDSNGVYTFTGLTSVQGLIIDFSKSGYLSSSVTTNPGLLVDSYVIDLPATLTPLPVDPTGGFAIQGWVYASAQPASGATVWLWDNTSSSYYKSTTTSATGNFAFTAVPASSYELRVFPYDTNANGVSNYRLFTEDLGEIDACTTSGAVGSTCASGVNLSDIVIELPEASHDIQAGSFVRLSTVSVNAPTGYPITGPELVDGVTGVLQDGGAPIFFQFGSEVDSSTVNIDLYQVDALNGGNQGQLIPTTVALDSTNTIMTITPSTALPGAADPDSQYQLRFHSLSFLDGTQLFDPTSTDFGTLTFDVQSISAPLPDPLPALFVSNETDTALPNKPRTATQAIVDSDTLWLADNNGDFLFGYDPALHWTNATGFELTWSTVAGAVSFNLYGRNTSGLNGSNVDDEQWQPLSGAISIGVSPNGQPTVYASGVMAGQFGNFGKPGAGPFSYANGVDIAVTSVDRNGFESPIDTTQVLTLSDHELPFLTSAVLDTSGTGALAANTELGNSFTKVMFLGFQEDMNTTLTPTLTSLGGNITVVANGITDVSWNPGNPSQPVQDSSDVAFNAQLRSRGTCTEVLASRNIAASTSTIPGDSIIPVRDTSYFTQSATQELVFVNPAATTAPAYYQADGISNIDTSLGLITLSAPLTSTGGGVVNQGDLVCSLSTSAGNMTSLSTSSGTATTATLVDSTPFYLGEQMMIVLPGPDTTRQSLVTTILFNDTTNDQIVTADLVSPTTFPAGSLVFPLPTAAGSEYGLRGESELSLRADQTTSGATDLELTANLPLPQIMKGDSILIDQDGDLDTTTDQAVIAITDVRSTNNDATFGNRLRISVDLPGALLPLVDSSAAKLIALGDAFQVGNSEDTSATSSTGALNPRQAVVSGNNLIY